jgi:acetylglutamate kinase
VPALLDLTTEYDEITTAGGLSPGQARLLKRAREIIDYSQGRVHVVITSPLDLLRELFTVRGAGTLVRQGARIQHRDSYEAGDVEALEKLISRAFGRKLRPGYFDKPIEGLYIADEFRGAAIVAPTPLGPYLSKFVVDVAAQGEGIGRDLWRALVKDVPSLFWRARKSNPIIAWYEQQCDGMARTPMEWQIFWRGLPAEKIPQAIAYAEALPPDLAPAAAGKPVASS